MNNRAPLSLILVRDLFFGAILAGGWYYLGLKMPEMVDQRYVWIVVFDALMTAVLVGLLAWELYGYETKEAAK